MCNPEVVVDGQQQMLDVVRCMKLYEGARQMSAVPVIIQCRKGPVIRSKGTRKAARRGCAGDRAVETITKKDSGGRGKGRCAGDCMAYVAGSAYSSKRFP